MGSLPHPRLMDSDTVIIILTLAFSAFFSAVEIAYISADRLHLAIQQKKGGYVTKVISYFISKPGYFISTTLIGNTVALVVYGIFMAKLLEPTIEEYLVLVLREAASGTISVLVMLVQTVVATLVVLITAEFLPKSISLVNPDAFLRFAAAPMHLIYWLIFPFSWLVMKLSKLLITRVFRLEYTEMKPVFGLTDLTNYLYKTATTTDTDEPEINKEIFNNALEFKTVKVRDCMVPRKEIVAVDIEDSINELRAKLIESGHSKILVYEDSIDNIVGYVHVLALFKKPHTVREATKDVMVVPETMLANELMVRFIAERKSLAIIVDEYGGTSGLVTIEDIMEEIFGEIEDEYDEDEYDVLEIAPNTFRLSARNEVEYLNEQYAFRIPEGDYDTLGGFIIYANRNNIPEAGDLIETEDFRIRIEGVQNARIDLVELTLLNRNKDAAERATKNL